MDILFVYCEILESGGLAQSHTTMPQDESGAKWAWYVLSLGSAPLYSLLWFVFIVEAICTDIDSSEPCVRGHRATRCDHFDRWMVRVKKPGRPLRECTHNRKNCECSKERVIMVQIPTGRHRPSTTGMDLFAYIVCRIDEVSLQDTT